VNATLLWPAHSDTSRMLHPAATRMATTLCRRPWKVMLGIPARMTAGLQTRRLNRLRARGPPPRGGKDQRVGLRADEVREMLVKATYH
jgi:hypothetical protein